MHILQILEEAGQEVPDGLPRMADKWEAFKEREAEAKKMFGGRGNILISRKKFFCNVLISRLLFFQYN